MSDEIIIYKNPRDPTEGIAGIIPTSDNKTQMSKNSEGSLSGRKVVLSNTSSVGSDFFLKKLNNT